MAQDSDVARVAAALKAPGIRYKSFGNDPVRGAVQPAGIVAKSFPLLGAAMETAAAAPMPLPEQSAEPEEFVAPDPEAPRSFLAQDPTAYAPPIAPVPAPQQHEPTPARTASPPAGTVGPPPSISQAPPVPDIGGAAAGHFPFGAPPAYPEPLAPYAASPGFGASVGPQDLPRHQPFSQAAAHAPDMATYGFGTPMADPAQNHYRLLESIGRPGEAQAPQQASHPSRGPAGGFGSLPSNEAPALMQNFGQGAPQQSAFQHAGYGQSGHGQAGFSPPAVPSGSWPSPMPTSSLLPAALITLPLAEVMRLVAVGAPVASSPFAAFRVSGGVPNAR